MPVHQYFGFIRAGFMELSVCNRDTSLTLHNKLYKREREKADLGYVYTGVVVYLGLLDHHVVRGPGYVGDSLAPEIPSLDPTIK